MRTMSTTNTMLPTNDASIRAALRRYLESHHAQDDKVRIIEELGISHGTCRIDIAVVNGMMHGYEIKSDQDTLQRLPEQIGIFNAVLDKITLVVGKSHLYDAVNMIPDWWGIIVAKNTNGQISFNRIREDDTNYEQNGLSIARLLWREEALRILEEVGAAKGLYSKPRAFIYQRLSAVLAPRALREKVRETLFVRAAWRPDTPLILNGG